MSNTNARGTLYNLLVSGLTIVFGYLLLLLVLQHYITHEPHRFRRHDLAWYIIVVRLRPRTFDLKAPLSFIFPGDHAINHDGRIVIEL